MDEHNRPWYHPTHWWDIAVYLVIVGLIAALTVPTILAYYRSIHP